MPIPTAPVKSFQLLGINHLCKLFNRSRPSIWRWRKNGTLPPPIMIGPSPFWRESDIIALIDDHDMSRRLDHV